MFYLSGVEKRSETREGVDPDRQNAGKNQKVEVCLFTFSLNKGSSPPLVSMETVDKVQETATVLER